MTMPKKAPKPDRFEQLINAVALTVESGFTKVQSELAATRAAVRLRGVEPRPVVTGAGGSARVTTSPTRLMGFLLCEATGAAPAKIRLWDGADTSGEPVGAIALAAGANAREFFGPQGIGLTQGLFVEVVTGLVEGTVLIGPA